MKVVDVCYKNKYASSINPSFCAGITNLYSDFDGTYMPSEFNHSSVCQNNPPVDKMKFSKYFNQLENFLNTIAGKNQADSKLQLSIVTGRNLHEFNYFLNKIRNNGLKIPLPDFLVTSNGGAEYKRSVSSSDFYSNKAPFAIRQEDFSIDKKNWLKNITGGWDGDIVKTDLKSILSDAIIDENFSNNFLILKHNLPEGTTDLEIKKIYLDLISPQVKSEELTSKITDLFSKNQMHRPSELLREDVSKLAWNLGEVKAQKFKLKFLETLTNNISASYDGDMSIQKQLEKLNLSKNYVAFRDDSDVTFHVALPENYEDFALILKTEKGQNVKTLDSFLKDYFDDLKTTKNIFTTLKFSKKDGESRLLSGEKGPSIRIRPNIDKIHCIDKFHEAKMRIDEIIKNNSNDLVIVAGDGKNDVKTLNLFNYIDGASADFDSNAKNPEILDKLKKLPVISIFVDNSSKSEKEVKISPDTKMKDADIFNSDGVLRFIHVDPNSPDKPHSLIEAVQLAIQEYSMQNKNFGENISPDLKNVLDNEKLSYPIKKLFVGFNSVGQQAKQNVGKVGSIVISGAFFCLAAGAFVFGYLKNKSQYNNKNKLGESAHEQKKSYSNYHSNSKFNTFPQNV